MLCHYLKHFGDVHLVHSRYPPVNLTHVGNKNTLKPIHNQWFSCSPVPERELHEYTVIFLYENPVSTLYYRFGHHHLYNIQSKYPQSTIDQMVSTKKDLFGIQEFYLNYMRARTSNYSIYYVKYEDFYDNIDTFNAVFNLPSIPDIYPIKPELPEFPCQKELSELYKGIINDMEYKPFIYKN